MAIKSRAARLLEKMSSKEKKVVYDVNGAQEVKETDQKKMEKPCCCKNEAFSVSDADNFEKLVKKCKSELDKISDAVDTGLILGNPLGYNEIRNAAISLKRTAEEIASIAGKKSYSDDQLKRAKASL